MFILILHLNVLYMNYILKFIVIYRNIILNLYSKLEFYIFFRWLEWIKACNRMDLMTLGPEYANQYYRLCHLHFRVEMFRNIEGRIYLSKEAVPSIFLKPVQAGK